MPGCRPARLCWSLSLTTIARSASKHHQAYVNGLNAAEEAYAKAAAPKEQIKLQSALKFNGGGHINHSLF